MMPGSEQGYEASIPALESLGESIVVTESIFGLALLVGGVERREGPQHG
jgi:hypothetical protein